MDEIPIWIYDENLRQVFLIPCPFCGSHFINESYDRRIVYKCPCCKYSRAFPGLIQNIPSEIQIPHTDNEGNEIPLETDPYPEYYHQHAPLYAIREMNKRVPFINNRFKFKEVL